MNRNNYQKFQTKLGICEANNLEKKNDKYFKSNKNDFLIYKICIKGFLKSKLINKNNFQYKSIGFKTDPHSIQNLYCRWKEK